MDIREAVRLSLQRATEKMAEDNSKQGAVIDDDGEESVGELQVAEYIVFLLALDTYLRYVEEVTGEENPVDVVIQKGIRLLRMADAEIDQYRSFFEEHLPSATLKKMLVKYFRLKATTPEGVGRRAYGLRTILSRGGSATQRAVFQNLRAVKQVREAISASMLGDADAALDIFAAFPLRNARLRTWIDLAADTAGKGDTPVNLIEVGAKEATDQQGSLLKGAIERASVTGAEAAKEAQEVQTEVLYQVQNDATESARKVLERTGESDEPPTRSEVLGIATAAAVAATSDPTNPQNVPEALRRLDDEQRAAALSDGRVSVFAGAGAGKSSTLVARTAYLVKERRVNPSRILVTSFNSKAAEELKEKIGKSVGGDALQQMSVGTMHSLFRRFIGEFGTQEEKVAVGMGAKGAVSGFVGDGKKIAYTVQRIWEDCFGKKDPTPKLKSVLTAMSQWSGNDVSPSDALEQASTKDELDAARWYEMYEGLKGTVPGWKPPCQSKAFESFMARNRPGGIRLGDFTDMLKIFRDILGRSEVVRAKVQSMFDHIIVDECVHEDTEVQTPDGEKRAIDVLVGDRILSFENGAAVFKRVVDKRLSSKTSGLVVKTESGREVSVTDEHLLYASEFDRECLPDDSMALYLMYRHDLGYRIGTTRKIGQRARYERADKLWVLEVGEPSEILFQEQAQSLRYAVSTYVFDATKRGCDQSRVDRIFAEFGANGKKLLDAYGLSEHYPHWVSISHGAHQQRFVIHLQAHRPGGLSGVPSMGAVSSFSFSWTGDKDLVPDWVPRYQIKGGRWAATFSSPSYQKTRAKAVALANEIGAALYETVMLHDDRYVLTPAQALYPGMRVLTHTSGHKTQLNSILRNADLREIAERVGFSFPSRGTFSLESYFKIRDLQIAAGETDVLPEPNTSMFGEEKIVEIRPGEGRYLDLAIEDSQNFFANGILSHNCQDRNTLMAETIDMMSGHITDGKDGKSVWLVGDDKQCCHVDTEVSTPKGVCRAGDLRPGNLVRSYANGDITSQTVSHVQPSNWTWGYKITTSSGKFLIVSPNHRIWVSEINPDKEGHLVYLMYRGGMGFRVGITSNGRTASNGRRSCVNRMAMENAEAIWFLDNLSDYEEALLAETSYSLQYGIPTAVFNGQWRNLNQDRIDAIFSKFGRNGIKLLEDRHLDPGLPHWTAYASSNGRRVRRVIQMLAHHSKGTLVSFEWSGSDLDDELAGFTPVHEAKGDNRRRLRRYFSSYKEGLDFAVLLKERTGAILNRRLSLGGTEEPYQLVHASGVFVGMRVAVLGDCEVDTEEVVSVEKIEGTFVDLSIADAANFFGNGILSHNSINSFQGAKAELFKELYQKEGQKTMVIRTNYRCEPEVVEAANKLIAYNEGNVPIPQVPAPGKVRGVGSIQVSAPHDEADAALSAVEGIKQSHVLGENLTDHAVLCRTNKEIHAYETACIIRGIPYARKGSSSFFGSPETKAVLGYVQLVTGTDFSKGQAALGDVINKPNRFFLSDPKKAPEAIKQVFGDYARMRGVDINSIDPVVALKDSLFVRSLAVKLAKLTRTGKGFKFEEKIEDLGYELEEMKAKTSDPDYTTRNLFDDILGLSGTAIVQGSFVDQTFRESLQAELKNAIGDDEGGDSDDDDDEEDTKGLGNVSFLYQLANIDPTDEDDEVTPPTTPHGFAAKMARYALKMKDLRTDINQWYKQQNALPPDQRKPPPGVYLGTVHSTKGAQWPTVYVQMPKGKFPMELRQKPGDPPPDPEKVREQLEDERRLAYVAVTRAAKNLRVVCPSVVGGKAGGVSVFVAEAGLNVGENILPTRVEAEEVTTETAEAPPFLKEALSDDAYTPWDPEDF